MTRDPITVRAIELSPGDYLVGSRRTVDHVERYVRGAPNQIAVYFTNGRSALFGRSTTVGIER